MVRGNDSENLVQTSSNLTVLSRINYYSLELCWFIFGVANYTALITVQNFYIDRICRVSKNYSAEECQNLTFGKYENEEKLVEVTASEYVMYQTLLENAFPILLSFFLGSWVDKYGSKTILIVVISGYFLSSLMYIAFSLLPDIAPVYILSCSVPLALGGGLTALAIAGISLASRQTPTAERSFRFAMLSVCFDGGGSIGYFMGEKVFKLLGYMDVFVMVAILYGLTVIVAMSLISETKPETTLVTSSTYSGRCAEFFDVTSVKDTIATCFKKRQSYRRRWIVILICGIVLQALSYFVKTYGYLYTRNKFQWDFADFSNYSIAQCLFANIGGLLMSIFAIKLLAIPDIYVGFITITSNLAGFLTVIFARSGWLMYLGSGVQMFGTISTPVMRSIMSKCVDQEEHGKLFSFVTCIELAMPFVAGSVYGVIYMNTVTVFPSAIFLLPIAIQLYLMSSYLYLHCTKRHISAYSALTSEDDSLST